MQLNHQTSPAGQLDDVQRRRIIFETHYELKCDGCNTDEYLVEEGGVTVCSNCGLVASQQVIDMGQEWHNYDDDGEDKSRVGAVSDPLLTNDLSTEIGNSKGSSSVLRAHIRAGKTNPDKNLKEGFQKIEELSEKMDLPSKYRNTAKELYKIMFDLKPIKSQKDIIGFVTAALYSACKIGGVPRQIKEFTALTGLEKKIIGKYYKRIESESKKLTQKGSLANEGLDLNYQGNTPAQMIPRFATSLKLKYKIQAAAEYVAQKAVEFGITSGKAPPTVAAAAIFMCTQLAPTKTPIKDIVDVTGVSEPTIRKCLKDLESNQSKLLPKDYP